MAEIKKILDQSGTEILPVTITNAVLNPSSIGGNLESRLETIEEDVSGKADKVTNATSGNLAGLDANGNLTDSGVSASSFPSDSNLVHKTGAETIGGMKTFLNSLLFGSNVDFQPTSAHQHEILISNGEMDQGGDVAVLNFEDIDEVGNVLLRGVATPTTNFDAANKKYVDDIVGDIETLLAAI